MAAATATGHQIRLDSSIKQLHDDMCRIAGIILAIAIERGYPARARATRAGQNGGALSRAVTEMKQAHGRLAAHFAPHLRNAVVLAGIVHDQYFASDLRKSLLYITKKWPDIASLVMHWNYNGNGGYFGVVIWRCELILMGHIHNDESLSHNTGRLSSVARRMNHWLKPLTLFAGSSWNPAKPFYRFPSTGSILSPWADISISSSVP